MYSCTICDKQLRNRRSYQNHVMRHQDDKQFICTVCPQQFPKEQLFHLHNINVHNVAKGFKCTDCEVEFSDLKLYKAHCRTHATKADEEPPKWQCTECGKMYVTMIVAHFLMATVVFDIVPSEQHLQHLSNIRIFVLTFASRRFVGESQLQRHNTYHSNVRSFECDVCNKMYKSKRDLRLHRMIHSSFRPHKCPDCDKTFLSTSKLKQHLNIHTGSRPYKCKYCSKDFTNFPNWLKHTRRRHKVDHKTGEKLIEMPSFLKSKPSKKPAEKKSVAKADTNSKKKEVKKVEPANIAVNGESPIKITNVCTLKQEKDVNQSLLSAPDELTNALNDLMAYPLSTQKSIPQTDLTTITVNDKTLPLNNSDDLERAASLLMQQTLDIEDEVVFHGVKCEVMDHDLYSDRHFFGYQMCDTPAVDKQDNVMNMLESDFYPFYYENSTLQYNMQPTLPPITTVKCRVSQNAPHTFTSTTNVL